MNVWNITLEKNEPTKAEKQIAIDAAKKIMTIYPKLTMQGSQRGVGMQHNMMWTVILREGHIKDFKSEYEAALYVLKQELMR